MKKCKQCDYKNEQWVGKDLNILYEYCGVLEEHTEAAIDINKITLCPIDLMRDWVELNSFTTKVKDA